MKLNFYLNIVVICLISSFCYSQQKKINSSTNMYFDYDGKEITSKLFKEKRSDTLNYKKTYNMTITDGVKYLYLVKKGTITKKSDDTLSINKLKYSNFKIELVPEKVNSFKWKTLIDDEEYDGSNPSFLDGKSLAYHLDQDATLWFKFEYYTSVKDYPAVSISLDTDNDQSNGVNWYGSNKKFKLDKMISVGPISKNSEHYIGYNGITDSDGVRTLNWINVSKNVVEFYHDNDNKIIYIGTKLTDLGLKKSQTVGLIGSVGTNATWNDDIGNESYVIIKIE